MKKLPLSIWIVIWVSVGMFIWTGRQVYLTTSWANQEMIKKQEFYKRNPIPLHR